MVSLVTRNSYSLSAESTLNRPCSSYPLFQIGKCESEYCQWHLIRTRQVYQWIPLSLVFSLPKSSRLVRDRQEVTEWDRKGAIISAIHTQKWPHEMFNRGSCWCRQSIDKQVARNARGWWAKCHSADELAKWEMKMEWDWSGQVGVGDDIVSTVCM